MKNFIINNIFPIMSMILFEILIIFYYIISPKKIEDKFGIPKNKIKKVGIISLVLMVIFTIFDWPKFPGGDFYYRENYMQQIFSIIFILLFILLLIYAVYLLDHKHKKALKTTSKIWMWGIIPALIVSVLILLATKFHILTSIPIVILFTGILIIIIIISIYYTTKNAIESFRNFFRD